jgi:hypothetical protein
MAAPASADSIRTFLTQEFVVVTSQNIESAMTRLKGLAHLNKAEEVHTVLQQGCVLQAMATDIELGNVPSDVDTSGFMTAATEYCTAVNQFCAKQ